MMQIFIASSMSKEVPDSTFSMSEQLSLRKKLHENTQRHLEFHHLLTDQHNVDDKLIEQFPRIVSVQLRKGEANDIINDGFPILESSKRLCNTLSSLNLSVTALNASGARNVR